MKRAWRSYHLMLKVVYIMLSRTAVRSILQGMEVTQKGFPSSLAPVQVAGQCPSIFGPQVEEGQTTPPLREDERGLD